MGTGAGARATAAMCKVGHEWKRAVQHGELCSMLCGDLNGKEVQEGGVCAYAGFPGGSAIKSQSATQES